MFYILRESIVEQNKDKRYWLRRIKDLNKIAQAYTDYLIALNDAVLTLAGEEDKEGEED